VVCGATGSGKSRLLHALHAQGAQVLDLEGLAQHRGSLLGNLPNQPQPPQKMFESRLWDTLRHFDSQYPVFVEAESRKIGNLAIPEALLDRIRQSDCVAIEAGMSARVKLLMEDYAHFLSDTGLLKQALSPLLELHGLKVLEHWNEMAERGDWPLLIADLLSRHYDPAYQRSTGNNFPRLNDAFQLDLAALEESDLSHAAQALVKYKIYRQSGD
jgi:tRNA 2-selenouridine synthase